MPARLTLSRRLAFAAVLLALVATAGCGSSAAQTGKDAAGGRVTSSGSGSASPSPRPTTRPTTSPTTAPATRTSTSAPTSAGSSSSSAAGALARCRTADLKATVSGGDGAMGSIYSRITLTNTSSRTCLVRGYGGVSYLVGADGAQVGAPAARDRTTMVRNVLLRPGQRAAARLQEAEAVNYPKAKCRPTKVAGLRIYPPDERHSIFVVHRATACANPRVGTMNLQPYAGVG